jgi:hypothetical protein
LSDEIAVPIVVGLRRARILLPSSSLDWTPACRRVVVQHELAHVRRGDLPWLVFARTLAAVLWFHPLVHFACARLRVEAERASDDTVLRDGEAPSVYAQMLLDLSTRLAARRFAAGVPLLRRGHLSERIESIIEANHSHAPLGVLAKLAVAPALLLAILAVTAPQLGRAAAEPESHWIQGRVRGVTGLSVHVLSVRARMSRVTETESVLDSPELELRNAGDRPIHSVSVRLVTPGLSTDQFWCAVSLAPGARSTLCIPQAHWANQGPVATLSAFEASVTAARETDVPETHARASQRRVWTATQGAQVPAEVFRAAGEPLVVENAWTPRNPPPSESEMDRGHDLTSTPSFDLRNTSTRTVQSVRIRYKADQESHAVTVVKGPIGPGQTLHVPEGRTMWGKPEAMTIQVLGVLFTDGTIWGSLDSTIDTRQAWIR